MSAVETLATNGVANNVTTSLANSVFDGLWSVLGTGLIHGTLLALLTLVLTKTLLRNARPALISALWTIVLIKFLVPVGPDMPISISGALDTLLYADEGIDVAPIAIAVDTNANASAPIATTGPDVWVWVRTGLLGSYLAIVLVLLGLKIRMQRVHRRWAESLDYPDAQLLTIAERACREVGVDSVPHLRVSPEVAGPQLVGLWQPILIVPEQAAALDPSLSTVERAEREVVVEAMLVHELAHLRRGDTWLRALQLIAASMFFFWPVMRFVNRRIDEHREMACDQWALEHGRLGAAEYARALVSMARAATTVGRRAPTRQLAPGMAFGGMILGMALLRERKQLHTRVEALMRGRTRPRIGLLSGVILAVFAVLSLGGNSQASERTSPIIDECTVEVGLVEYIKLAYPEADTDGDGQLSRDEVCAQKKKLQELGALEEEPDTSTSVLPSLSPDPVLSSLDPAWFECQACGCSTDSEDANDMFESVDKKICTRN